MTPIAAVAPLIGIQRIEASAGTGKTWTLSGLYLRLIVEKGLPINQVLAVTFTKAATSELRDRVRARLQSMLRLLGGESVDDVICEAIVARATEPGLVRKRTLAALRGFDDAQVFTIHGFCQRALRDQALACGLPFELEVIADVRPIVLSVVQDFWRRSIACAKTPEQDAEMHALFARWLMNQGASPAALASWLSDLLAKPDPLIDLDPLPPPPTSAGLIAELFENAKLQWMSKHPELIALVTQNPALDGRSYKSESMVKLAAEIDRYFVGGDLFKSPENFKRFSSSGIAGATKKNQISPRHAFFDTAEGLLEAIEPFKRFFKARWLEMRIDLFRSASIAVRNRLTEQRQQSYSDMLENLLDALRGTNGERLAATLRARYPAALIDEFQDTDPVQYEIFRRIYGAQVGSDAGLDESVALFLVGDPKQAIYEFRGADIFTYLRAAKASPDHHTLSENQRSVPHLVQATNTLFDARSNPFLFDQIKFSPVNASRRAKAALTDTNGIDDSPFRVFFLRAGESGKPNSKGSASEWAVRTTAHEIASLLHQAEAGTLRLGDRALRSGDIAVLVHTKRQGREICRSLSNLGIGSVIRTGESVFESRGAEQMELVLAAIVEPHREPLVRAALTTDLVGDLASNLIDYEENDAAWERRLAQFQHYHDNWNQLGFMRMFRRLLLEQTAVERLSKYDDGPRRLTNLFHLAELLHGQSELLAGIERQFAWFADQRRSLFQNEACELRLESDENLIQILTIHSSKGLEYPIAFVPFLWHVSNRPESRESRETTAYHDPERDGLAVLDCGTSRQDEARRLAQREKLAERLRLAYVALTRARNRTYICCGVISEAEKSALGWLLRSADAEPDPPSEASLLKAIDGLCARAEGSISLADDPLRVPRLKNSHSIWAPLIAQSISRSLPVATRISSFSALNDRSHEWQSEQPDHDQVAEIPGSELDRKATPNGGSRFSFPRGAAAGHCLHDMLERIDFTDRSGWDTVIAASLLKAGFPQTWAQEVNTWLTQVCCTPLPAGAHREPFALRDLDRASVRRELEFYLPLDNLNIGRIPEVAAQYGLKLAPMPVERIAGFLKGFIDLVTLRDGRYFVVDYKSNWLGGDRSAYSLKAVEQAMVSGGYHLQYLIYVVALNRWLQSILPGYAYETHFGGVQYLFIRGMDVPLAGSNEASLGIFFSRPPEALIRDLDRLMEPGRATPFFV